MTFAQPIDNLTDLSTALASAPSDVQSVLAVATRTLSRQRPATWMALVMNPNPDTSRVVVADDADNAMAEYIEAFIATIDRPNRTPTIGLAQGVIEAGEPIFKSGFAVAELLSVLSPVAQVFMRSNPPPGNPREVDFLIVPMRVGGATVGTLAAADWNRRGAVTESDIEWVQAAADRIGLSLELARLVGAVQDDSVRLDLVRSIGLAVRQRQDLNLVARVVVEQLTSRLDVDAADFFLLSEGGDELVLASSAGFRVAPAQGLRVARSSISAFGESWEPGVRRLADVDRKAHNPRSAHFAREGFRTFVTVPLHARNRLLGVLELFNRDVVEWERRWLEFYDMLGGLVGMAIEHATTGGPEAVRPKPGQVPRPNLSDLELEVLRLIVEGFTNGDIAEQVHRSENTIKFHVRRILERTGVSNRTELARRATREGWL